MVIDWLDPVLTGFRHRETIKTLLLGGIAKVFGKKASIAFTGMEGVGKSVLLDHLTGKATQASYSRPLRSQALESGRIKSTKRRILVSVVPGQDANPRYVALDQLLRGKSAVEGIIHVVGAGFASVRSPDAVQVLIKDLKINTIRKYRDNQLKRELEDLEQTCEEIRASHQKHRAPRWMIIAVDKIDLYHDRIDEWRKYYSSEATSEFSEQLRKLAHRVGTDFFRWEAVPVCGCLEAFEWNGKTVPSQIDESKRQAYLEQFLQFLESYCA